MPPRLWFRPSQVAETTDIYARCRKCLHMRDLDLAALPDVPLIKIEPRLRCDWRGKDGKQPPCGHRAEIGLRVHTVYGPGVFEPAAPLKPGAASGTARSSGATVPASGTATPQ